MKGPRTTGPRTTGPTTKSTKSMNNKSNKLKIGMRHKAMRHFLTDELGQTNGGRKWTLHSTVLHSLVCLLLPALFTVSAVAQGEFPTNNNPTPALPAGDNSLLLTLIPLIVPILVALGKRLLPFVPKWALPTLATGLGTLIDYLGSLVTGGTASPLLATIAGAAGVGLREIVDQVKQKAIGPIALVLLACGLGGFMGCKSNGAYDPVRTQQVKDALEPVVRIGVRRVIANNDKHAADLGVYFRTVGNVFCTMKRNGQFDPSTLTSQLQLVLPPKSLEKDGIQELLDLKVAVEALYKNFWSDRFRAELPPDKWGYHVADYFCAAIGNGLVDSGLPGIPET